MLKKSPIIITVALIVLVVYAVGSALAGSVVAPGSTTTIVTLKVNPGNLSMDTSDTATLNAVDLDGYDKTTTGTLGTIRVTDARGTGQGWNVVVAGSNFEEESSSTVIIPNTTFTVEPPVIVNKITGNGGVDGYSGNLSGAGFTLLNADDVTKKGRGINETNPDLQLFVPAETFVGTYTSTVTETLQSNS